MTKTEKPYVCTWYSPRGFANEGTNFYGTLEEWGAFVARVLQDHCSPDAKSRIVSNHSTLDAARARAEKEVGVSRRRESWGETDYTRVCALSDVLVDE